jgi:hypothetical protein
MNQNKQATDGCFQESLLHNTMKENTTTKQNSSLQLQRAEIIFVLWNSYQLFSLLAALLLQ